MTTTTELIAIGYPDQDAAALAMQEIERLSRDLVIRPDEVAAIVRDENGDTTTLTNANISPNAPFWAMFWPMLLALLYYAPVLGLPVGRSVGDIIDAIATSGIDVDFQTRARGLLTPDSSVLFLIVEHVPVEMVVEALERFGGTVLQCPLTDETQSRLQEVLHGRTFARPR